MTFEEWLAEYPYEVDVCVKSDMKQAWDAAMEQADYQQSRSLVLADLLVEGYALVPVEPTDKMFEAGCRVFDKGGFLASIYGAMIQAAQEEE